MGYRNVKNPAVARLIAELDKAKQEAAGFDGVEALRRALDLHEKSMVLQPKVWQGRPVEWTDEEGVTRMVLELRSPSGAAKGLELSAKLAGVMVEKARRYLLPA